MNRFVTGVLSLTLMAGMVGCRSPEVGRKDPGGDTHLDTEPGLYECKETAKKLADKLRNFNRFAPSKAPDGLPRCRLLKIINETDRHFNVDILTDEVDKVLADTGKIVLVTDARRLEELKKAEDYEKNSGDVDPNEAMESGKGAGARYVLYGRLKNLRKQDDDGKENTIIFTLQIDDQQRRETVPGLKENAEFRLTKS
jgi:hypothetical protein